MPRCVGKVDVVQERVGVNVVEAPVDLGHRDSRQWGGGARVQTDQVAQPERRAAKREHHRVPWRCARQAAKCVAVSRCVDQRVIVDRSQPSQAGVAAAQQIPEVVVLAKERVEPAIHRQCLLFGPPADAAAEVVLALYHVDADAAFGQPGGGGQSGDACADHHGVRPRPQQSGVGQAGTRLVRDATRIFVTVGGHAGACAMNV